MRDTLASRLHVGSPMTTTREPLSIASDLAASGATFALDGDRPSFDARQKRLWAEAHADAATHDKVLDVLRRILSRPIVPMASARSTGSDS